MALLALSEGFGPSFYILLGSREDLKHAVEGAIGTNEEQPKFWLATVFNPELLKALSGTCTHD